jgi:hypothetical protein
MGVQRAPPKAAAQENQMSRNEWQNGTIILPSAAVAPLRKTLRDAANAHAANVLALCLSQWNGPLGKTTSVRLFNERLRNITITPNGWGRGTEKVISDAYQVLDDLTRGTWNGKGFTVVRPRTPRATDVDKVAPRANTRTTTFSGDDWHVAIDGSRLIWSVSDNNHSIERAHEHPVVVALFRALNAIKWTRATGGTIVGNDEYNQESREAGGGQNYISETFGPIGEEAQARQIGMTLAKYRQMTKQAVATSRQRYLPYYG